jgi:SAM-dependent methyltransferase
VSLQSLARTWNELAEMDPMWAVLMLPDRFGNLWEPREFFRTGFEDVTHFLHMVRNLEFPLRRGRALDFGCGVGRLTQGLACYFDDVDGVDIAPAMIRAAQAYNPYGPRCRFHVNQRDDLSIFPDGHFDFILSIIVLQHMEPAFARRYVAEFLRVLAPGGMLVFQQPSHRVAHVIDNDYVPRATRWWRSLRGMLGRPYLPDACDRQVPDHTLGDVQITRPKCKRLEPIVAAQASPLRVDGAVPVSAPHGASHARREPPEAETHTIRRGAMIRHLRRHGGKVVFVAHRAECDQHHASYRYYVTR